MGFLDKYFGNSGGNDDLRYGQQKANEFLDQGLNSYTRQINTGLNQAQQYYQPYIDQGLNANQFYGDAIGLNGYDQQQGYFDEFQNDPGFQASLDQGLDAVERSASARGGLFSGRNQQALFDTAQSAQYGAFQDRLNRLQGLSGQGQQAGSQFGNLTYGTNENIANAQFGVNQQKAAGVTNLQNSIASTRGSGFNSLLNGANSFLTGYNSSKRI